MAKKHGISEPTTYRWRKRFGKVEPVNVKRLRRLEQANAKLKKLLAERARRGKSVASPLFNDRSMAAAQALFRAALNQNGVPWPLRFCRGGFGWRASRLASERIAEALAAIRAAARRDPLHAADGAVRFLVRLSPALAQEDRFALGGPTD